MATRPKSSRPFDTFYDPTFTVSDTRDIYRDVNRLNPPQIERVPVFDNMFSESRVHPSHSYRIKQDNKLPPPIPPSSFVASGRHENAEVSGSQRFKYFKRPVMQLMDSKPSYSLDHLIGFRQATKVDTEKERLKTSEIKDKVEEPKTKTQATQSLYRESEAQTVPYSVPLRPEDEEKDCLLTRMRVLKYGDGLPATQETLVAIDRIQRRMNVEQNLPTGTDKKAFNTRLKMLKDLETIEWNERNAQIKEEREEMVKKMREYIQEREKNIERRHAQRVDEIRKAKQAILERKLEKINNLRMKQTRKIIKKYDNPEKKIVKRDIIKEYSFYGSRTYAPFMREGRITDKNPIGYEIRPVLLTDPNGVEEIERSYLDKILTVEQPDEKVVVPNLPNVIVPKIPLRTIEARRQKEFEEHLGYAINAIKAKPEEEQKIDIYELYKATPRIVRPQTPTLELQDDNEDVELAVILIQKLLRGRTAQISYLEGKERTLELIKELQAVQDVKDREKLMKKKEKTEKDEKEHQEKLKPYLVDNIQGQVISSTLDYLAKELVRQEELRKVENMMVIAEMERRKREAEELGRRQREEELRRREEEEFNQMIVKNTETINSYITDLFIETIDEVAYNQALQHVYEYTKALVEKNKQRRELSLNPEEEEVKDLVASFLLPQVKRETVKKKLVADQHKYIKAVHETIYNEVIGIVENACK